MSEITRRAALGAAATLIAGAVRASDEPPPPTPPVRSAQLAAGIVLHVIQTGWVSVKTPHRAFAGPAFLRLPAIIASNSWTEWLPVTAFVIERPDALIVVDTGETARATDPDYAACDSGVGWFYRRNLRFALTEADEIGPQMRRIGLDPARVETVAMTHLHSDHMGGMGWFPGAEFLISSRDFDGHQGALPCREPKGLRRTAVDYDDAPIGAFPASRRITADGAVSLIPTPGHTPGHQSVAIAAEGRHWILGGDAVFSTGQVARGEIAGIVEDHAAARRTVALLREELRSGETILIPSHDPVAAGSL